MKDKLLQILDEVQRTMSLCQELTQEDATKMTMGVLLLKVTKAKQLLSAPIAEQGKSAEDTIKLLLEQIDALNKSRYVMEQDYLELRQRFFEESNKVKEMTSQSPIKQEVSESQIWTLVSKLPEEQFDKSPSECYVDGFKAGQQHSIGKLNNNTKTE